MKNRIYGFILLFFLSNFTYAAGAWTDFQSITHIYVHSGANGLYVQLDAPVTNPGQCASEDWYFIEGTSPLFQEVFSLLLAAKKSGEKVNLYIEDCADQRSKIVAAQE